jgi:uncharacterized DUF497 family protein
MIDLNKLSGFQWDRWNIDKSYKKHGITPNETEEVFLDENVKIKKDIRHQEQEDRFIAIGKTTENKMLFVVFTMRADKVRVISGRMANKKEKEVYQKNK